MAEKKYDLALINTKTDKKIRLQPWYKERLQTKHIKSLDKKDTSRSLVGKNWIFMRDGLDDFRDGLPPLVEGDIFIKGQKGPGPNVKGSSENVQSVKQPAVRKRFTKYQSCYSRLTPLQQQRRDHIEEIEYGLAQHPLALYPHLNESVDPQLFEDIVDILDPEMNFDEDGSLAEEEEDEEEGSENYEEEKDSQNEDSKSDVDKDTQGSDEPAPPRNFYRWLPRKDEKDSKDKKKGQSSEHDSSQKEEHIKMVTKEFCEWVASLGGETNNIEESTITSLFASGYETKPALSVPIHVVELTNVPPELRMSATTSQQKQASKVIPEEEQKKSRWQYSNSKYEPSWVKFNYGAWYLDPKSWKRRDAEIPLLDPKKIKEQEMSEAKKKSKSLNTDIAQLHGSKAFMDFMDKKTKDDPSKRKPEFLDEVAEIQRLAAEEEQRKKEAELAAKNKKLFGRTKHEAEEVAA